MHFSSYITPTDKQFAKGNHELIFEFQIFEIQIQTQVPAPVLCNTILHSIQINKPNNLNSKIINQGALVSGD